MKKYPEILKDEAVKLAAATSLKNAEKLTGVGLWTIRKHAQKQRAAQGIKLRVPSIPRKYTKAQRKECERLAKNLFSSGMVKGKQKAWAMAGKRMGLNGLAVMRLYDNGLLYAPFNTQQKSGGS